MSPQDHVHACAAHDATPLSRFRRGVYVTAGAVFVGIGAVGIVVPGLPTTVFLLIASFFFSRSCPALTDRWLRRGVFAPYMRYVDERRPMPFHARVVALAFMWTGTALAVRTWESAWADVSVLVAAGIGSVAVLLVRRPESSGCPVLGLVESVAPVQPARDITIP